MGNSPQMFSQQDVYDLIQIRDALKTKGDPRASKVDAIIQGQIREMKEASKPGEVPGLLSGEYQGETGTVAPGESLPHAVTRQTLGGIGRAAKGLATFGVPTSLDEAPGLLIPGMGALGVAGIQGIKGQAAEVQKAFELAKQKRYSEAAGHSLAAANPLVGPMVSSATERAVEGTVGPAAELGALAASGKPLGILGGKLAKTAAPAARQAAIDPAVAYEEIGLGARNHLREVQRGVQAEVGKHYQHVVDTVDRRNPRGAIEAPEMVVKTLKDGVEKYFNTYTPIGAKLPGDLRYVAQEAMLSPGRRWTFAQTKDVRTALEKMREIADDKRVKAVMTPAINEITKQMKNAADREGVLSSFEKANRLHSIERQMGEQVFDKAAEAGSGKDVLGALKGQEGFVKTHAEALKAYGLDADGLVGAIESYIHDAHPKAQRGLIDHWAVRHVGGAIAQSIGAPWIAGYAATGIAQNALERGRTPTVDRNTPLAQRGKGVVAESLPEPPSPLAQPTPIPPQPPPRTAPQIPPSSALAPRGWAAPPETPIPTTPATKVVSEPLQTAAEPVASKYEAAHEAVKDASRRKSAIAMLTGKKPTTDNMFAWVEKRTGLDMADPGNVAKALEILKTEEKEYGKPTEKVASPKAPSKPAPEQVNPYEIQHQPATSPEVPQVEAPVSQVSEVGAVGAAPAQPGASVPPPPPEAPAAKPRTPEQVNAEIDQLAGIAEQRREAAQDPSIRALRPTGTDWMTEEELQHFTRLQWEYEALTKAESSRDAAAKRVAEKREARKRLNESVSPTPPPAPASPAGAAPAEHPKLTEAKKRFQAAKGGTIPPREVSSGKVGEAESGVLQAVQEPNRAAGPAVRGGETSIPIPGEARSYAARYEVRELEDVQASHSGINFNPNPKYKIANDRTYTSASDRGMVLSESLPAKFKPEVILSDNPDATNGPTIIDEAGNALGGNARRMILERVYKLNPEGAKAYRKKLMEKAYGLGFADLEAIDRMKQPVLVRVIDNTSLRNIGEKQRAVSDFNKRGTKDLKPSERAVSDSKNVSQETLEDISKKLADFSEDVTLTQLLTGEEGKIILQNLTADGVISPQEWASLIDKNGLTEAGKSRISNLVVGRFFIDPTQMESLQPALRAKLERIAAPVTRAAAVEGGDLTPIIREALEVIEQERAEGFISGYDKNFEKVVSQGNIFGRTEHSEQAIDFAKALKTKSGLQLVKSVREYAESILHPRLFQEQLTPKQAFKENFKE